MDPDGVAELVHTSVPHVLQKFLWRNELSGVEHQVFQQGRLFPCQSQRLPVHLHRAGEGIKFQRPTDGPHVGLYVPAAQEDTDTGLQFVKGEGLGQVVVRAGVQPQHPFGHAGACGQQQRLELRPLQTDLLQHLEAVLSRQVQVQKQQVISIRDRPLCRLIPVAAHIHRVAIHPQPLRNGFRKLQFILYN